MAEIIVPPDEMNAFDLPPVCVMTGERQGVSFQKVAFVYYPPWARVIGGLIGALFARRAKGELPFTERGHKQWKVAQAMSVFSVLLGVFSILGGIGAAVLVDGDAAPIVGMGVGALMIASAIALHLARVRGRIVRCTKIDKEAVTLQIPSEAAAQAIRDHLFGNTAKPAVPVPVAAVVPR